MAMRFIIMTAMMMTATMIVTVVVIGTIIVMWGTRRLLNHYCDRNEKYNYLQLKN